MTRTRRMRPSGGRCRSNSAQVWELNCRSSERLSGWAAAVCDGHVVQCWVGSQCLDLKTCQILLTPARPGV